MNGRQWQLGGVATTPVIVVVAVPHLLQRHFEGVHKESVDTDQIASAGMT